jgi:gamma-glutamyltranspeptidase/glutathione hydrolase
VADENGVPFLAVGSPGNWALVSAVAIAISNVIDYDMNVAEAVNAPRVYRDQNSKNLTIESRYSQETMDKLTALGFSLTNEGELGSHVGCVAAVYHKPGDKYYAAADYRRFYGSAAY